MGIKQRELGTFNSLCAYNTYKAKPRGQMKIGLKNRYQELNPKVEIKIGNYSSGQRMNRSEVSSAKVHDDYHSS